MIGRKREERGVESIAPNSSIFSCWSGDARRRQLQGVEVQRTRPVEKLGCDQLDEVRGPGEIEPTGPCAEHQLIGCAKIRVVERAEV